MIAVLIPVYVFSVCDLLQSPVCGEISDECIVTLRGFCSFNIRGPGAFNLESSPPSRLETCVECRAGDQSLLRMEPRNRLLSRRFINTPHLIVLDQRSQPLLLSAVLSKTFKHYGRRSPYTYSETLIFVRRQ